MDTKRKNTTVSLTFDRDSKEGCRSYRGHGDLTPHGSNGRRPRKGSPSGA